MKWLNLFSHRIGLKEMLDGSDGILDVGCANGSKLGSLEATTIRVGIDIQKYQPDSRIMFIQADACFLPFKNDSFEVVTSSEAVSHIWNLEGALQEMIRVAANRVYIKDSNILNPLVVLKILRKIGIKWLWEKECIHRISMRENIHSPFWWKKCVANMSLQSSRTFQSKVLTWFWQLLGPDVTFNISKVN